MNCRRIDIPTVDGQTLSSRLFRHPVENNKITIFCAHMTHDQFSQGRFDRWAWCLQNSDYVDYFFREKCDDRDNDNHMGTSSFVSDVLTFDYRGIGESGRTIPEVVLNDPEGFEGQNVIEYCFRI